MTQDTQDYLFDFFKDEAAIMGNPSACLAFLKELRQDLRRVDIGPGIPKNRG